MERVCSGRAAKEKVQRRKGGEAGVERQSAKSAMAHKNLRICKLSVCFGVTGGRKGAAAVAVVILSWMVCSLKTMGVWVLFKRVGGVG